MIETYPPDVAAIDPLALALRDLRGGTGQAAGFIDAEDATALRRAMAARGLAMVPAALPEACAALARSEAGTAARLHGEPDAASRREFWPEMEAMVQALDLALPGWRALPRRLRPDG